MSKIILGLFIWATLGCGVKGPPEPPLPTEGSLKKELKEENQQLAPIVEPKPEEPQPTKKIKKKNRTKAQ